jgi:hemerythrin
MALFAWSDDLSVKNAFIDADHKKLIGMVNDFHDAMQQGRGNDVVGKVLNNLVIYTREHFGREEAEMRRIKYPHYLTHKQEHDKLLHEVAALQDSFHSGKAMLTVTVSKFLRNWLLSHIRQTDQQLGMALA